ncbi:MAG: adenosylcobinamide-GDP ribazoletransferase [Streptosporangiaceae bacterium]
MAWAGLRLALTFLTAVPLPGRPAGDGPPTRRIAAAAMYWAPLVGLAIGGVAAGVLLLASRYGHSGPFLAAVLAIASMAALTRALHLDGLADLADGLGSRKPADQALDIMRRSDIGPFGVVTLLLTMLAQVGALARAEQLGRGLVAIVAAAVAARLAIMVACRATVRSARPAGLGALVAGTVQPPAAVLICALVLAAAAATGGWHLAAAVGLGLGASLALTRLAQRRLGGITGDVLGAIAEVTTAVCLLVTALS